MGVTWTGIDRFRSQTRAVKNDGTSTISYSNNFECSVDQWIHASDGLELDRGELAEAALTAPAVIGAFDPVGDLLATSALQASR